MTDPVLLDPSACFALLENEPGADTVEGYLLSAQAGQLTIFGSFATLAEVEYIITQVQTAGDAAAALLKMKAWPVSWQHTDDALCSAAAKLKAGHRISFADAFVAATAQRFGAILIHKDPEMRGLNDVIKLEELPMKTQ